MKRNGIALKGIIVILVICLFAFSILLLILINNNIEKIYMDNKDIKVEDNIENINNENNKIENNQEKEVDNENYTISNKKYSITIPVGFDVINTNNTTEEILKLEDYSNYLNDENISKGIVIKDNIGNEFVWIPVNNVNELYVIDDNNYKSGRLYDIIAYIAENGSIDEAIKQNLVEYNEKVDKKFNNILYKIESYNFDKLTDKVITINEPNIVDFYDDDDELKKQLEKEFEDMLKSVEKYKGFYIGRYETGDLSKVRPVVKKNNTDLGNQNWYDMYSKCKKINDNKNVTTSMIWGCQWDRTVLFLLDNLDGDNLLLNCNIVNNIIYDENSKIIKNKGETKLLPTGNITTKNNNIYDMSGNVFEWTIEKNDLNARIARGGYFETNDILTDRKGFTPYQQNKVLGCRSVMMINL